MSKVLEASCVAGVVTIDGLVVPGCIILSEGVSDSSGLVFLDKDATPTYIGKTSPDLKTTIGKISDSLTQIATALSAIDVKPVGGVGSAPAPAAAANIVQITALQVELSALQEMLK